MKFHIVGNGESVNDILEGYDISLDELKNENKHIRIWNHLIPGTKLKIPVLTESIIEELHEVEPFIEDYYPKITVEDQQYTIIEDEEIEDDFQEILTEENNEKEKENIIDEDIKDNRNKEILSDQKKDNEKLKYNNSMFRYPYLTPIYYYPPIIYVIPRRKNSR